VRRVVVALLCAWVSGSAVGVWAQQTPTTQQPVFRAGVQLVRVDAVVTDAAGNPVHGLTPDAFEVFDRGRPQPIATFAEVQHVAPTAVSLAHRDVASNTVSDAGRLVVLVLDDFHIRKEWTDRARNVARDFVLSLGDDATIALLSTTGHYNVELTEDRTRILEAIDRFVGGEYKLEYRAPGPSADSARYHDSAPGIDPALATYLHLGGGLPSPPSSILIAHGRDGCGTGSLEGVVYDSASLFKLLERAARVLGTEDSRHKAFVWVSTGVGFGMQGLPNAIDAMRRAGVVTYAIDPVGTGSAVPGAAYHGLDSPCPTPWDVVADAKRSSLTTTSRQSGGIAIVNDDDLAGGVRRIVQDLDAYYLLGFYPEDAVTSGARSLVVKVTRPDLMVRSRVSYTLATPPSRKLADPLGALSAGLVPKRDLPLRLYAVAMPTPTKSARVVVTLEVTGPQSSLTSASGQVVDTLKYAIYVVDLDKGAVVRSIANDAKVSRDLPAPLDRVASQTTRVTYAVETSLSLPPGQYQLRASATSASLATGGSVYLPLDVPDFSKAPLALSGIVLGYADGPRVPVGRTSAPIPPGAARLASATSSGVLPFAPSLSREFVTSDTLRVYCEVAQQHHPTAGRATIQLVDTSDRIVTTLDVQFPARDRHHVDVEVPLRDLAAGAYRVRVTATDGTHTTQREVGVSVK
jgi:VWFA-related protein